MARPPRIPMWLQSDQRVTYFVTLCVKDRRHVLAQRNVFAAIERFCRENENWNTIAAVVMPDHIHALVSPKLNRDERITRFSAALKRFISRETRATWQWQHGVFDRLLRRQEFGESKWGYMRENPVRAGFVDNWEEWPYFIGYDEEPNNTAA